MRRKRRYWVILAFLGLLSSVASADTCTSQACAYVPGVPYLIPAGPSVSFLDGVIGPEWSGAFAKPTSAAVDGRRLPITVYLVHDGEYLYLGVRIEAKDRYADFLRISVCFGNEDASFYSPGDNLILLTEDRGQGVSPGADYHYENYDSPALDLSQDAQGRGGWDSFERAYEFELKVKLASGDPEDFQVQVGVPFALVIGLTTVGREKEAAVTVRTPGLLVTI